MTQDREYNPGMDQQDDKGTQTGGGMGAKSDDEMTNA